MGLHTMGNTFTVLTVRQPWAHLIVTGQKDIENRSWPTKLRGRVLIHAAKTVDRDAYDSLRPLADVAMPDLADMPRQAIVGSVMIDGCVDHSDSEWFSGPFGFTLRDAVRFDRHIHTRGKLGFFRLRIDGLDAGTQVVPVDVAIIR